MVSTLPIGVVERCCGTRKKGGVYLEVDLDGRPIDDALLCPPIMVDPGELGISPKGVKVIDDGASGVLMDWVGNRDYPNVADWIEEASRLGISRRLPSNLEFDQLSEDTRLLMVHAKACVLNSRAYWAEDDADPWCPKRLAEHIDPIYRGQGGMCGAIWWQDLTGGDALDGRTVSRRMPTFRYLGRRRPDGVAPIYAPGIFLQQRISRLVVVRDPDGGRHDAVFARASEADLPVVLVDA